MPSRSNRRHPSRPAIVRLLGVVLVAVSLLATACSDAHTQAQRDWVDPGIDPNVLSLLAAPSLTPVLTALGQAFQTVRPDTTLVFVNQVTATTGKRNRVDSNLTNTQIIQSGASPALWIDVAAVLKPYAKDSRAQGPILPFAVEPLVLAVKVGNPAGVTGLNAFEAGGPTAGRCSTKAPCGKLGAAWLAAAKIKPSYEVKALDAPQLLEAITKGQADAGLVLALDVPPAGPTLTTVPVATPPAPSITYRMLCMSTNPTATQFEKWVATSPQARAILTTYRLLPGTGRAAA